MQYDFDRLIDRRGTGSMKWDVGDTELPMWVADMDFMTSPQIVQAIQNRAATGVYGYTAVPDAWYDAIAGWWQRRHHFTIEKDWLMFCTGVVPAISSIVRKMTTVGDNILVQTPVYNVFFNSIQNNGRHEVRCPLTYDRKTYGIDFEKLEKMLSDPQTTMMILCNPHNPVGKIWDRETLERIGQLAARHHVLVLSDEIHCDLTDPGTEYVPFASVSETCRDISITCIAPTKTFNLAGLQTAAIMAPDPVLRHKVCRGINTDEVAEPNVFAIEAAVAAFTEGEPWLEALREYLAGNKKFVRDFIRERLPQVHVVDSQATYLLWLDCMDVKGAHGRNLCQFIREDSGLYLSDGYVYRAEDPFLRMNVACPRSRVEDGVKRLEQSIHAFEQKMI